MRRASRLLPIASLLAALPTCSPDDAPQPPTAAACAPLPGGAFETGDPEGHADPFGARAASQARAGRIRDAAAFPQPAHGRQRVQDGDFVLINDKISVVIEDRGMSDGYARFGGEILAIDQVGDDGRPRGLSRYVETLVGVSIEAVQPESITVLNDGSDGAPAVVRVVGVLAPIPFMSESFGTIFPNRYGLPVAQDFVLAPGSDKLDVTLHVANTRPEPIDFGVERLDSDEMLGFFQGSQNQMVTAEYAYGEPEGEVAWAGFDGGDFSFAWRSPRGPLEYGLTISGFSLYFGPGFTADACAVATVEQAEIIAGGPGYDGLREAIRRVDGEAPWREVRGTLADAAGAPVAGAWVHLLDAAGGYLSRTTTAADGSYLVHAPPGDDVTLVPQKRGYPAHAGAVAHPGEDVADLAFAPTAAIHVTATDAAAGGPLPVRIQVIPAEAQPATPEDRGVLDEVDGRLHQEFAVSGEATLVVPPGEHRVVVSRGYEWELLDTTVTAAAGQTVDVAAPLARSVDSAGVFCADFHIHSFLSSDSPDPIDHKVRGAVADGLDIPVSSEHEWVLDFQPFIQDLGLTDWAFGMGSEELTTFKFGHFGVVPLDPQPDQPNSGAIDWIGKDPAALFGAVHERAEKPVLIVNHPRSTGFEGYFSTALYDPETGTGKDGFWSDSFDAIEVFNDSDLEANREGSLVDWFSMLDRGRRVVAVGSSDSHRLRTSPVGYPRTCMFFGHDDLSSLTPAAVRDALASGNSTVSGGIFMTVEGPGGERPGQVVLTSGAATFTVTVQAPSWVDAQTLEVFVNGKSVSVEPLLPLGSGPGKRFVNQVQVSLDPARDESWVVFHAKGEADLAPLHPGRRAFAASNPVFLKAM